MRKLTFISTIYIISWIGILYACKSFGVPGDYITSGTAAAVGYFAYLVYEIDQINKLKSAAKTVVLDVRNAEEALNAVRGGANYVAWSKVGIIETNWPTLKQYFITLLTTDEFRCYEQFFHAWSELGAAKKRFEELQYAGLLSKSEYVQQRLLDLENVPPADLEAKRSLIINRLNNEQFLFEPGLPQQQLAHFLTSLQPISCTTGFEKLRRLAGMR
ncbi:hypothetical protein [Massilia yuzhufengensis]|uniref:Uncharacterized protein n=1 Tax=Massilia yuzhufengensis TaxID=1164594 RepID=A0A1I1JAG1_9BURK|nr:hypothetical protein [Massilia yuzhufengensis]SFC45446.1 hypothetical protein SAMN05216204_106123 [Massilia yuzhufengensis]